VTYRTKMFLSALSAAIVALVVAAALVSWSFRGQLEARIERTLVAQTGLAAAALEAHPGAFDIDRIADELGRLTGARVTVIAADGRVLGDSEVEPGDLAAVENHARRPEVIAAQTREVGLARRYSTTVGYDMLYSARKLSAGAAGSSVGWVRLAIPLTEVDEQLGAVGRAIWPAFAAAIAVALAGAWGISRQLTRRLQEIAAATERHAGPDPLLAVPAEGTDEIGRVARVVNESARALQTQLTVVAADRALLSAILSGMMEGVVVVDERGRVQLANDAAHAMLGIGSRGAGAEQHYLEIIRHPDVAEHLSRALGGEATGGTEFVLHRDPERTYIARAGPVSVDEADVVTAGGAVLVLHDVTDLRRADRVRRDFVANVSHELRTPLTAIRGYVEALLDGPEESAERRRFLEIVDRHAARMERLVKDLLRLARLDAGQEQSAPEPVRLDVVLGAVESELAPAFQRKRVTLERRIAPDAAVIRADPAKLHDVLRNLLENAVNYSAEGGIVMVSADALEPGIVLRVEDEGPGIPAADLDRVFERFYRVDKARAHDPGGTGLGLAIVKHLVGLHGGTVRAANRPERGALFTVELPHASGSTGSVA
jgi:two-component system, OmpR family, phosphate regulon sensor histidine kinase PhoR